jgi:pyruvate dehydrogenase E2 component (dihydrolipoamide acetyltransferase)
MAKDIEVQVPDIGDYQDVPIIDILVKVGDTVEKDAPLLTLESEKATIDVPAPSAGTIGSLIVKVGDKVSRGAAVLTMSVDGGTAPAAPTLAPASATAAAAPAPKTPAPTKAEAPAPVPQAAKPAEATSSAKAPVAVTVPDIGDFHDIPVIELFVSEGDTVEKDASLMTLESDKATLDVPAPAAGVIRNLKLKVGDKVSKGSAVCDIETSGAAVAPAAKVEPATPTAAPPPQPPPLPTTAEPTAAPAAAPTSSDLPHASPSIRKAAREFGVDLARVIGTAPKGRITLEDVQGFVKKALQSPPPVASPAATGNVGWPGPIPAVDFSLFGTIETKPLARIRKLSAAHLHRAWVNIPHVTQTDEADITDLEAFRKSQSDEGGVKLTLLPFIMKAVAKAMETYPEFSASLSPDGNSLIMKKYVHIGFAADTPNGLMVPVVRDVDKKGIAQLATETSELAKKARDGKLKPDEMKGGCFSISSLGGIGGSHFTPIVNAPEVGILGVSRGVMKPIWDGKAFQPRLMVPLSLSYDHRVIDGAYAARFIVLLVKLLSDLRRLAI